MPQTAIQTSPVSTTLIIAMKEKLSLEQLLQQAGIDDDDGSALHFWLEAGRQFDRPVWVSGVEVHFFQHPGGRLLEHMRQVLWNEKMMAPSAREIFCFAATKLEQFKEQLRVGPIVITTPEKNDVPSPFMLISLIDGQIRLRRLQRTADFQGCQFAGVCFTPIGE